MSFTLLLRDQFPFPDGRTVLAGVVEDYSSIIGQTLADVFVDGKQYCRIQIEGEWLTEKRTRREERAVSTLAKIVLPADWRRRDVRIIGK